MLGVLIRRVFLFSFWSGFFEKRWVLGKTGVIVLVVLSHFCSLFLVDPGLCGFPETSP